MRCDAIAIAYDYDGHATATHLSLPRPYLDSARFDSYRILELATSWNSYFAVITSSELKFQIRRGGGCDPGCEATRAPRNSRWTGHPIISGWTRQVTTQSVPQLQIARCHLHNGLCAYLKQIQSHPHVFQTHKTVLIYSRFLLQGKHLNRIAIPRSTNQTYPHCARDSTKLFPGIAVLHQLICMKALPSVWMR